MSNIPERPDLDRIQRGAHSTQEGDQLIQYVEALEQALVLTTACANGRALDALKALMDQTGSCNWENPWLGVTAAVALLKIDAENRRG